MNSGINEIEDLNQGKIDLEGIKNLNMVIFSICFRETFMPEFKPIDAAD